jgi:hypothetical protein
MHRSRSGRWRATPAWGITVPDLGRPGTLRLPRAASNQPATRLGPPRLYQIRPGCPPSGTLQTQDVQHRRIQVRARPPCTAVLPAPQIASGILEVGCLASPSMLRPTIWQEPAVRCDEAGSASQMAPETAFWAASVTTTVPRSVSAASALGATRGERTFTARDMNPHPNNCRGSSQDPPPSMPNRRNSPIHTVT